METHLPRSERWAVVIIYLEGDVDGIIAELHYKLLERGDPVDTGHWQAMKDVPMTKTIELLNVSISSLIPPGKGGAVWEVDPNMPWAEDHFQERVGGNPTNPGDQYYNWPFWRGGHRDENEQFSHTYQERIWPRKAGPSIGWDTEEMQGIRYRYGDLDDVISLLNEEPFTRQAWLPIWFPEDTGAHHGERVPCSLGYHFIIRRKKLHVMYAIRSVDFLRHFRDDIYMAMRLGQEVRQRLAHRDWLEMGMLTMHMVSLHVFEGDLPRMNMNKPVRP